MDRAEQSIAAAPTNAARRWQLVWLAAAAVALLALVWQWPFFVGRDLPRVATYVIHHGYILAWMLVLTAFTRTISLRTLAAFWFVGVFPVMAIVLLIGRPIDDMFNGGQLAYAYLGPSVEELTKALPVVLLFAYRVRRVGWQLSASDGLLLGFVVGAGFAFHEDAGYNRVWGEGFGATTWSPLFPTLGYFRGATLPYHDVMAALVGLSIGFGFLFRRNPLAWIVPVVVWLAVLAEHVTGNLRDISGGVAFPADVIRSLLMDGELLPTALVVGIVSVVVLEWVILRRIARRDHLFPPIRLRAWIDVSRQRTRGGLHQLQAMRTYVRQRRSLYYTIWTRTLRAEPLAGAAAILLVLGLDAGVPVEEGLEAYAEAPLEPAELPALEVENPSLA